MLAGSLVLNATPFWWGAGPYRTWAFDEILPGQVVGHRGWPQKYPPLYRSLSRAVLMPAEWMELGPRLGWNRHETLHAYLLIMRLISVVLGTATVWLVYRLGSRLGGWRAGWFAGAAIALSPSFAYYAKTANLDAVSLFFFAASAFAALRWIDKRTFMSAAGMTLFAAAAIATKTSAWALYPLWPLAFLLTPRWSTRAMDEPVLPHPVRDWRLWAALGLGCAALALFFHWPRVMTVQQHLEAVSRAVETTGHDWPNTVAGHAGLIADGLVQCAYVLGLPLSVAAVAGLGLMLHRRELRSVALLVLLTAISNYGLYIAVVRFQAERYYLPVAILGAATAGYALDRLMSVSRHPRVAAGVVIAVLFGWAGARAVAVDLLMLKDSRLAAERWLSVQPRADSALSIGRSEFPPRGTEVWPWLRLGGDRCARLAPADPGIVFVSPDDAWNVAERNTLRLLLDGHSGLRIARTFVRPTWSDWFIPRNSVTNLDKISPTIVALIPSGEPCRDRRWLMQEAGGLLAAPQDDRAERLTRFLLDYWETGHRILLPDEAVATGLDLDGWSYGDAPAALALANRSDRHWRPRVELQGYVATPDDPQPIELLINGRRQELLLTESRWRRLRTRPLAPGEEQLIVIRSERFGTPSPGSRKHFGVRVRVVR